MDELETTEGTQKREKGLDALSHLLGTKDEEITFLPDLSHEGLNKVARRHFTEREKIALIEEDGAASNAHKVDVKGTHYENQSASEIAMMILPMLGL